MLLMEARQLLNTKHYTAGDLAWSDASLWEQFSELAAAAPHALAVVGPDGQLWTREDMRKMALLVSEALTRGGVRPHDRIMLQGKKSAPILAAALAISAVGAIACPYTPDLGGAERAVLDERLNHIASIGDDAGVEIDGLRQLKLQLRERSLLGPADARDAQTALIGFTSGTTGVPKGVMHGPAALNYTVRACSQVARLEPGDAILGIVPLGSAPGFTFTAHFALSMGHPLIMIDPWDPVKTLKAIDVYRCRWGICVPTHLATLIEVARLKGWHNTSPLKALGVGGSAMTPELIQDAKSMLGMTALRMFGMSECMGHASVGLDDDIERKMHSDGKSFPGTRDEAFGADNELLPRGQRGQAGVLGPSSFLGYCIGLGEQEHRLTSEGFFLTGDEVIVGEDGYLKVVGRIKDQIIRGGYNIDASEVEAALLRHPAIAIAIVVAVPEKRLGEQACAVCCIREGSAQPTLDDIKEHLLQIGLSKKKWPEYLLVREDMLYTATGKIDKKHIAKAAIEQLGLGAQK
jgi:acyl-CoA synthetase